GNIDIDKESRAFPAHDYIFQPPVTSELSVPGNQLINGKRFFFSSWSDGNTDNPREMSLTAPASLTANLKGLQITTCPTTLANNGQRKFVRMDNGTLFCVYESMDQIWGEVSTDGGATWQISNLNHPLSASNGHSPCMYSDGYYVLLAYQENNIATGKSLIKILSVSADHDLTPILRYAYEVSNPQMEDLKPVIGFNNAQQSVCLLWKFDGEIYVKWGYCLLDNYPFLHVYMRDNANTKLGFYFQDDRQNCDNLSLSVCTTNSYASTYYNLVWQEDTSPNSSQIDFASFHIYKPDPNNGSTWYIVKDGSIQNLSANCGYPKNTKPSIMSLENYGTHQECARVVWSASLENEIDDMTTVAFRAPTNTSRYWYFGSYVNSPTITPELNNKYFIGWAQVPGTTIQDYWVDNTLSNINVKSIGNLNARDVQITGMGNKTTARAIGLSGTAAPYSFAVKPLLTGNAVATEGTIVTTAIEGTVNYPDAGGVSFNYKLGDISVDGDPISFVEADPLIIFQTVEDMNQYLVSQTFTLNDRSEFFYSIECLPVQPEYVEALFQDGSSLSFTVQLVDASTEEIIGTYDNVVFDATHTSDYRNIMFDVDCNGIGDRTVKLRLQITNTAVGGEVVQGSFIVPLPEGQTAKMMSKVKEDRISFWRNNGAVAKKTATIKKITFKGKAAKGTDADAVITEYALDQNYPNPFNPVTTINYQLPKAGIVTLKIYDMLGKEVKVLVSQYKESGKYTAEFNGASLASGVYVYRLDCNDFHATKKLTLLK
ncbi:MAG: T9SS type A sorting domain-containing protein, partial [Ignavibacteriales bacterium]|nr:T9SS type A sorting domain-containing protein [Ignavibacteriales bacterium]